MAVDRGYGSGKPRSAANSSMRRRVAAGQRTKGKVSVLAKRNAAAAPSMARDKYNEKTASGLARGVTDLTGFNARDGVDLGDIAALGLMIPAGVAGGVARVASRLLPKGLRIAGAAGRTVSRATSRLSDAEKAISSAKEMETAGTALRNSVRYSTPGQNTTRLGIDFANPVGNRPNQAYNYAIKDVARKAIPEGTKSAYEIGTTGRLMQEGGRTAAYNALKAARRSERIVEGGKYEASEEIKRRLAALQRAKRNR